MLYNPLDLKDNVFGSPYFSNPVPNSTFPLPAEIPNLPSSPKTFSKTASANTLPEKTSGFTSLNVVNPPLDSKLVSLQSIPEDYGFNSSLCVVCQNLVPSIKRGEIASFFKDCTISLDKDFSTKVYFFFLSFLFSNTQNLFLKKKKKVQFLKGVDNGSCFVEFESQKDVERALEKNGSKIGEVVITVGRSSGALVSESGQKFTFTVATRNAPGMPGTILSKNENESKSPLKGTNELNHMAPEFKPTKASPSLYPEEVSPKKNIPSKFQNF